MLEFIESAEVSALLQVAHHKEEYAEREETRCEITVKERSQLFVFPEKTDEQDDPEANDRQISEIIAKPHLIEETEQIKKKSPQDQGEDSALFKRLSADHDDQTGKGNDPEEGNDRRHHPYFIKNI